MEIYIQDPNIVLPRIKKHFLKNPNASISALFRKLRSLPYLSAIGDYPLLSLIISARSEIGVWVKRSSVRRAVRYSKELSGRKALVDQLLSHQITTQNSSKIAHIALNTNKLTNQSSKGKIEE